MSNDKAQLSLLGVSRAKGFKKKYLEGDVPGGCQHPVTEYVAAKAVDREKVGREGVRGAEGSGELEGRHFN